MTYRPIETINYEAFEKHQFLRALKQTIVTKKFYGLILFFTVAIFADYYILPDSNQGLFTQWSFLFVVLSIGTLVSMQYEQINRMMWSRFARSNGWKTSFFKNDNLPPSLRNVGTRDSFIRTLHPIVEGNEWSLTPYIYEYPKGKRADKYSVLILRYVLPKKLPYIAIDSRANNGGLVQVPEGFEIVSPEGSFDTFFTVLVQKGLYTDALSILTPDVLAVLQDNLKRYDVEIVDDQLYVLAPVDIKDVNEIQALLEAGHKLSIELVHRCKTLQYQAGKTFDYRGKYYRAITIKNARYHRSLLMETIREARWKKILIVILLVVFVLLYSRYLIIDN